jgi:O-antigen ligase
MGLIFTRSRMGVSLAMVGILLCSLAFSRRLGGSNVYGLYGTVTAITLALAIEVGLAPVLDRFTLQDPLSDGRWSIFAGTLQAIGEFFPIGSGLGSFVEVFPRFHPADFINGAVINRAHNDYLEWTMGGGLVVPALLAIMLVLYLRQWPRVWTREIWSTFRFLQTGAGIAMLLMLLHSLVDFNLHIPANGIFFAFLAAVFFHRYPGEKMPRPSPEQSRERHRESTIALPQGVPPENAVNPFDLP